MAEPIKLTVTAQDDASKILDDVRAKGEALNKEKVVVEVVADDAEAQAVLQEDLDKVSSLDAQPAVINVVAEDAEAQAILDEDIQRAAALDAEPAVIDITAVDTAAPVLESDLTLLEAINGTVATATVTVNDEASGVMAQEATQAEALATGLTGVEAAAVTMASSITAALQASAGVATGLTTAAQAAQAAQVAIGSVNTYVHELGDRAQGAETAIEPLLESLFELERANILVAQSFQTADAAMAQAIAQYGVGSASMEQLGTGSAEAATNMEAFGAAVQSAGAAANESAAGFAAAEEGASAAGIAMEEASGGASVGVRDISRLGVIAGAAGISFGGLSNRVITSAIALTAFSGLGAQFAIPIIGGLVGLGAVLSSLDNTNKEVTESTKALTKAYEDLGDKLPTDGLSTFNSHIHDLLKDSPTLVDNLQRSGVTAGQFSDAVQGKYSPAVQKARDLMTELKGAEERYQTSGDATVQVVAAMAQAHGITSEAMRTQINAAQGVTTAIDNETKANENAKTTTDELNTVTADLSTTVADGGESQKEYLASVQAVTQAAKDQRQALLDDAKALQALNDTLQAAADDQFAYNKAERDAQQAQDDLASKIKDINAEEKKGKIDSATAERERQQAYDDTAVAATNAAAAQVKYIEAQETGAGKTVTATEHIDNMNASLLTSVATTEGPVKQSLINYIAQLNGISPEKATEILANTDPNNLAEKKALLDQVSAARTVALKVDADTSAANAAIREVLSHDGDSIVIRVTTVTDTGGLSVTQGRFKMSGGPINESGIYEVGEAGRERVFLPAGANVMTAGQVMTADALGLGGGSTHIINLNVKVDPTVNLAVAGREIAGALDAFYRSSGSRPRAAA